MPENEADWKVEIVSDADEANYKVLIVEGGAALPVDMAGANDGDVLVVDGAGVSAGGQREAIGVAVTDELTVITTGAATVTFRMPFAMDLTGVRASLTTASSSGVVTVDINEGGTSVLSTKLSIDANEKTSTTAAAPAVVSDAALADDAEMTVDIDAAGTGAKGLKVWLLGRRA